MSNNEMMRQFVAQSEGKKKPKPEPEPSTSPKQEPLKSKPTDEKPSWRNLYPVHPAADIFPMLPEEELRKLGEDIKANGLQESIVLWSDGNEQHYILDGRNRLTAMELVGMEIRRDHLDRSDFARFVNIDPYAYVISANIHRRHLTPQQRVLLADQVLRARKIAEEDRSGNLPRSVKRDAVSGQLQGSEKGHIAQVAEAAKVDKKTARKYLSETEQPSETRHQPQRRKRKIEEANPDEPLTAGLLYAQFRPQALNLPLSEQRQLLTHLRDLMNELEDEVGM